MIPNPVIQTSPCPWTRFTTKTNGCVCVLCSLDLALSSRAASSFNWILERRGRLCMMIMRVERLRILAGYHAYPLVVSSQMESWHDQVRYILCQHILSFGLNLFEVCSTVLYAGPQRMKQIPFSARKLNKFWLHRGIGNEPQVKNHFDVTSCSSLILSL